MCYEMQYLEECWQMYSHLKWFILNNVPLNHVQVWKWRAYPFNNALLLLLLACSFQLMVPFTSFLPYLSDMGLLLPFIVFVKSSICKRNLCCCSVSSCLQISYVQRGWHIVFNVDLVSRQAIIKYHIARA